jgi:hypothetical protein
MKKPIILSFIVILIGIVMGKALNNWMLTIILSGVVGSICLGIAGIINGVFINSDRNRANYFYEAKEDRDKRDKITNFLFVVGFPNIILVVIVFLIISNS